MPKPIAQTDEGGQLRAALPGRRRQPDPLVDEQHLDVLDHGGLRQKVVLRKDKAKVAAANLGELIVVHLRHISAGQVVMAMSRRSRQPIRFSKVDFPDPDGPMRATNSPCATSTVRPSSARTSTGPS